MGTGLLLRDWFVLASCSQEGILDPGTQILVTNVSQNLPLTLPEGSIDVEKMRGNPTFHECEETFLFSEVTTVPSRPVDFGEGKKISGSTFLSDFAEMLSQRSFSITSGKVRLETQNDLILLRLKTAVPEVSLIELSSSSEVSEMQRGYGVGSLIRWHFANGEKSLEGNTFAGGDVIPLSYQKNPHLVFPFLERESPTPSIRLAKQIFVQGLTPIPGKPKAFGYFEKHTESDESFKIGKSLAFHSILHNTEDAEAIADVHMFGPIVGGASGGPVFLQKEDGSFQVYGLASSSCPGSLRFGDEEGMRQTTYNIFQTFTPDVVARIREIMGQ